MTLFICNLEEFWPVVDCARRLPGVSLRRRGHYAELQSDVPIVIDRRATGVRHAVWYSVIAGVSGGRVAQFDADALALQPE